VRFVLVPLCLDILIIMTLDDVAVWICFILCDVGDLDPYSIAALLKSSFNYAEYEGLHGKTKTDMATVWHSDDGRRYGTRHSPSMGNEPWRQINKRRRSAKMSRRGSGGCGLTTGTAGGVGGAAPLVSSRMASILIDQLTARPSHVGSLVNAPAPDSTICMFRLNGCFR